MLQINRSHAVIYPSLNTHYIKLNPSVPTRARIRRQGHVEVSICDTSDESQNPGGVPNQECFNQYPLTRDAGDGDASPIDPNYPGRYYVEPPCRASETDQNFNKDEMPNLKGYEAYSVKMRYVLPAGLTCSHCVVQMHYCELFRFLLGHRGVGVYVVLLFRSKEGFRLLLFYLHFLRTCCGSIVSTHRVIVNQLTTVKRIFMPTPARILPSTRSLSRFTLPRDDTSRRSKLQTHRLRRVQPSLLAQHLRAQQGRLDEHLGYRRTLRGKHEVPGRVLELLGHRDRFRYVRESFVLFIPCLWCT